MNKETKSTECKLCHNYFVSYGEFSLKECPQCQPEPSKSEKKYNPYFAKGEIIKLQPDYVICKPHEVEAVKNFLNSPSQPKAKECNCPISNERYWHEKGCPAVQLKKDECGFCRSIVPKGYSHVCMQKPQPQADEGIQCEKCKAILPHSNCPMEPNFYSPQENGADWEKKMLQIWPENLMGYCIGCDIKTVKVWCECGDMTTLYEDEKYVRTILEKEIQIKARGCGGGTGKMS